MRRLFEEKGRAMEEMKNLKSEIEDQKAQRIKKTDGSSKISKALRVITEPSLSTSSANEPKLTSSKVVWALFPPERTSKNDPVYECPACNEIFEDPPVKIYNFIMKFQLKRSCHCRKLIFFSLFQMESWIECNVCLKWWHENYTSAQPGIFICDFCNVWIE